MFTVLIIIGVIIILCCFGVFAKIVGFVLSLIWAMLGWAMDGCLGFIIIGIILMFIIGSFII